MKIKLKLGHGDMRFLGGILAGLWESGKVYTVDKRVGEYATQVDGRFEEVKPKSEDKKG